MCVCVCVCVCIKHCVLYELIPMLNMFEER